jgi:hypothetical protein
MWYVDETNSNSKLIGLNLTLQNLKIFQATIVSTKY